MFRLDEFMGKRVLKSSLMNDENITAFFTTKDLPLKAGEREDLIEQVEENKKLVCKNLNIPFENLFIPSQTHSDNVEVIDLNKKDYPNCDGLITNIPNIAIVLNFADCVPIIFYDPIKKVVAIAHAGWRGTASKIGPKTVQKMVENFTCNSGNIIALIGPAIGQCCFEVQEEVKQKLLDTLDKTQHSQVCTNNNLDLKLINKSQLLANGIKKIELCEYCTSCQNELFFSYRKENGKTARHSAVIILKGEV